ncbi:hypothetical protein Hanom_Chr01g00003801 [Helianthus anomalus]
MGILFQKNIKNKTKKEYLDCENECVWFYRGTAAPVKNFSQNTPLSLVNSNGLLLVVCCFLKESLAILDFKFKFSCLRKSTQKLSCLIASFFSSSF